MPQPDPATVTLAILAGGAGSRMGLPKSHLEIHGQPILQYLLRRFQWPGPTLLVTSPGRQNPPAASEFNLEVADPIPDQGPLRGLLTALEHSSTPWVLACTTDMPLVQPLHLHWLLEQSSSHPDSLGLMIQPQAGQIEPFPSLFHTSATDPIAQQLLQSRRSVHGLARLSGFSVVSAPAEWDSKVWTNLNNRNDLHQFLDTL
jgi:molybdopterin-guanine dinucleotide biosynthesis protein A